MAVLVGIDEAGFGPILGPLVVSSSTFSLPREMLKEDMWSILTKSLAPKRTRLVGRLLICDSKKAYSKSTGIKHLERTVLACLEALGKSPNTLADILTILCPTCLSRLSSYPWYQNITDRQLSQKTTDIKIASGALTNDMTSKSIKLLNIRSDCLDVAHYNKMVDAVKNKANVLFTSTSGLIKVAFDTYGCDDLQIIVDRQGGRTHYRDPLLRMFPHTELTILSENQTNSSYQLTYGDKTMRIHFTVGGDKRFLPVALASMVSKYLRELMIGCLNDYFIQFDPGLKPTAGYWTDGLRFINDIKTHLHNVSVDSNLLVRSR